MISFWSHTSSTITVLSFEAKNMTMDYIMVSVVQLTV